MKSLKTILLVQLSVMLVLATTSFAKDHPWDQKLPFKSGTIHYSISGMEDGTETLYVKEYGAESAMYHTGKTKMMGMVMETKTVEFVDPDWVYQYDLTEQTGVKSVNPMKYMIEEYMALSSGDKKKVEKNIEAMGANYAGMGTVEMNATEILGYDCDKATAMGATTYVIHGTEIPLKMEMNTMGMTMNVTALEVDEGSVDSKHFEHPTGIDLYHDEQGSAAAKAMAHETVTSLVEGEIMAPSDAAAQERMKNVPEEDQAEMQQAMEMMKGLFGN